MTTGINRADLIDIVTYALRHKAKVALPGKSATGERYDLLRYRIAAEKIIDHMELAGVVFDRAPPRRPHSIPAG
jgi:hypothetical protein